MWKGISNRQLSQANSSAGHYTQVGATSGAISGQHQNPLYAFYTRHDQECSPNVV